MRRRLTVTALAAALAALGAACNGILGIGAPTLAERDGGSTDGSQPRDATGDGPRADAKGDATRGDAGEDGGHGKDATTDGPARDASDAGDSAPPSDARTFDGNCTCTGDACAPILLAQVPLGITSIAAAPAGVCFYSSDVLVSPFHAFVGCVDWSGKLTVLDTTGEDPATVATNGADVYWVHTDAIEECTLTSCTPKPLASGGFFEGQLVLGPTQMYWNQSDGLHACALSGVCDGGAPIPGSISGTLTANADGVFWVNAESLIDFCSTAGCPDGGTPLNADASAGGLLATDTNLYWYQSDTGDIATCPLAGGACQSPPRVLVPSTAMLQVGRLAADSTGLYWVNPDIAAIERVGLDGGAVATLAATPTTSFTTAQLTLGQSCVLWGVTQGDAGLLYAGPK